MSSAKAFLCSQDGTYNFPLSAKITTIGRENCDIVINSNTIDLQHAVIQYEENENAYILQDLNSVNGTFINDFRLQNSAVRITEQDVIRFGFNGIPFQFIVHQSQFMTIPPINLGSTLQRPSVQPLQLINQTLPSRSNFINQVSTTSASNMWQNNPIPNASLISINNQQQSQQQQGISSSKPHASLRSRPISAGTSNGRLFKEVNSKTNSWVKGYCNQSTNIPSPVVDSETYRQEDGGEQLSNRVSQLERELKNKALEIKDLKEKVSFYQSQQTFGQAATPFSSGATISNAEVDQIKRDKSIAVGLVNTMQKDLANKDSTISKLAREIEGYKNKLKEREVSLKDLEEKLSGMVDSKKLDEDKINKEKELIVLKTKFKNTEDRVIDLTNQILQIKNELEESQRQSIKQLQSEKRLKEELEIAKSQYLDMQRAERTVRIDLEQSRRIYEKFRNSIIQSVFSTPDISRPVGETNDEDILGSWRKIINQRTQLFEKIDNLKEQNESLKSNLKTSESSLSQNIQFISSLENELTLIETRVATSDRKSEAIQTGITMLREKKANSNMSGLIECLITIYTNEMNFSKKMEELIKNNLKIDINSGESLCSSIEKMVSKFEARITELKEAHSKQLVSELDKNTNEINTKLIELEADLNQKHLVNIDNLKKEHEEFIKLIRDDYSQKNNDLSQESLKLSEKITELNVLLTETQNQLEIFKANDKTSELSETIKVVNDQLRAKEQAYLEQIDSLKTFAMETEANYNAELSIHKEQLKQHSITIVNFEKEVNRLKKKETDYSNKIEALEKKLKENNDSSTSTVSKSTTSFNIQSQSAQSTSYITPQALVTETFNNDSLNRTIEQLRNESQKYKIRINELEDLVKTLRRDLSGASAKLSDVHGEMTEKQKRELERNKQLVLEQQRELSDNRAQMAKLSEIVDKQTKQLEAIKNELNKSKALVDKYRKTSEENGNLASELTAKLEGVDMQLKQFDNSKREEGKIATELTAVGAQCKGERHEQVISRQREALNELRLRVKTLEQTRPAIPSHQQQMQQQIMLLKKQLAEVRASQALTEDIAKQANLARGNDHTFLMLEEKTAHFETQTALDASEESYLTLLRNIGALLEIRELDGLRSMGNLPPEERQRLVNERAKSIEIICHKINTIQEGLQRKDQLLRDYELDLAKLRQAEFLLDKKSEQLDDVQMFSRGKEDEIEYLKESLRNTKSELEREKLLNAAIKQKKPLSSVQSTTERVRRGSTDTLHHHCPPEDIRSNMVRKNMNEKIKRKDYELKTLKQEIKSKSEEVTNLTNKLTINQNDYKK